MSHYDIDILWSDFGAWHLFEEVGQESGDIEEVDAVAWKEVYSFGVNQKK